MIEQADRKRTQKIPARTKKISRKKPRTPRARVRSALRKLWMLSRERSAALTRDGYTCQECGVKQSVAKGKEQKVEVHHLAGQIPWEALIDYIMRHLLVDPSELVTVCPKCHEHIHETGEF